MIQRLGISISDQELKYVDVLRKRFGVRSRSEFFRVLLHRYEALEGHLNSLNQTLQGYLKHPESSAQAEAIVKITLKDLPSEDWASS